LISPELASFVEGGVSVIVGTRDAQLFGESLRGVGARVSADRSELTIFVPAATGSITADNLRDNGRIAVCFSRIADHRTVQLKGQLVALTEASAEDRKTIERYRAAFLEAIGWVGLPPRLTLRLAHWPAWAVRFRVESVYMQTPGPGAGELLRPQSGVSA
jgi:hypothetical protein